MIFAPLWAYFFNFSLYIVRMAKSSGGGNFPPWEAQPGELPPFPYPVLRRCLYMQNWYFLRQKNLPFSNQNCMISIVTYGQTYKLRQELPLWTLSWSVLLSADYAAELDQSCLKNHGYNFKIKSLILNAKFLPGDILCSLRSCRLQELQRALKNCAYIHICTFKQVLEETLGVQRASVMKDGRTVGPKSNLLSSHGTWKLQRRRIICYFFKSVLFFSVNNLFS